MDTLDRPDVNLPARLQPGSSRLPAQIHVASRELAAAAPPSPVNSRLLWRGLMRHWWHILLLWLVVSIPGVYLVYSLIEPTYDASSTLRIEPSPELFGPSAKGIGPDFGQYLETQRALILSNRVLEPAVANIKQDPGYQPSKFPVIRESNDPKADVRKRLGVSIVPNTYLIHVAFSSPSAIEAAEVVNQVVSAFDQENRLFNEGMNGVLKVNYERYLKKLDADLEHKQKEMIVLAERLESQVSKSTSREDDARPRSRANEVRISFIRDELNSLNDIINSVRRKLEQLNFESQRNTARVYVVDAASASRTPQSDRRQFWMMLLPVAVFIMLLGFFLVLDARSQPPRPAVRDPNLP
jgi:capsular polysaccharide biosynthesis protein